MHQLLLPPKNSKPRKKAPPSPTPYRQPTEIEFGKIELGEIELGETGPHLEPAHNSSQLGKWRSQSRLPMKLPTGPPKTPRRQTPSITGIPQRDFSLDPFKLQTLPETPKIKKVS